LVPVAILPITIGPVCWHEMLLFEGFSNQFPLVSRSITLRSKCTRWQVTPLTFGSGTASTTIPLPVQSLLNRPTSSARDTAAEKHKSRVRDSCRNIVAKPFCRDERHSSMPDSVAIIETDIPGRLDRLPWTRFHTLVVVALGITWILDGLEVTLAGSIARALHAHPVLSFLPPHP